MSVAPIKSLHISQGIERVFHMHGRAALPRRRNMSKNEASLRRYLARTRQKEADYLLGRPDTNLNMIQLAESDDVSCDIKVAAVITDHQGMGTHQRNGGLSLPVAVYIPMASSWGEIATNEDGPQWFLLKTRALVIDWSKQQFAPLIAAFDSQWLATLHSFG